jgi:hypothetical protein
MPAPPSVGDVAPSGFAVTKSDSTTFSRMPRALYVGGAGAVTIRTAEGVNLTFSGVPAGGYVFCQCDRVLSTGTDATNIVALY